MELAPPPSLLKSDSKNKKHDILIKTCGKARCKTCKNNTYTPTFLSTITNVKYQIRNHFPEPLTCFSQNLIYLITCQRCNIQYVGETARPLNLRMNNHRSDIKKHKFSLVTEHFKGNGKCNLTHFKVQPIEKIPETKDPKKTKILRLSRESFWIKELRTLTPYGLNNKLDGQNWRLRSRDDIAGKVFNSKKSQRGKRGSKRTKKHLKKNYTILSFIQNLISFYGNLKTWRFCTRKEINRLSMKQLKTLIWEFVDNSKNLHNLPTEVSELVVDMINFRIFQNKENSTKQKSMFFIPVYFQGKNVERIGLSSIFRSFNKLFPNFPNNNPSSINPNCTNITSHPTIIYKRSKTIGSYIFNYRKVVEDICTENWKFGNNNKCDCEKSVFRDKHHQHIVTGDLRVIEDKDLRKLFCKGPKYREPQNVNWDHFLSSFQVTLKDCTKKWAKKLKIKILKFTEWENKVMKEVSHKIESIKKRKKRFYKKMIFSTPKKKLKMDELHEKYVFVPTDKANNNISVVCKNFYIEQSLRELKIFKEHKHDDNNGRTYIEIKKNIDSIIRRHINYSKRKIPNAEVPKYLPLLYWIPKMHKKPHSKQRFIAASGCCTTKPISSLLTKVLKLIENTLRGFCAYYHKNYGINPMWILKNSTSVHKILASFNRKKIAKLLKTYDFSTLYTSIPHKKLKTKISWVIRKAFNFSKKKFISIYGNYAKWTNFQRKNTLSMDCKEITNLVRWLINNIYVILGDKCFKQVIGIPMGTDCAPFLANLFLFACEFQWIDKQRKANKYHLLKKFLGCGRYIDDLLMINNDHAMDKVMSEIYPKELILVPDDSTGLSVSFLDLKLIIKDNVIYSHIYDKRDMFDFPVVNFPILSGNIPLCSSYGVFVGELVRYARACTYFMDFEKRTLSLVTKLLKQFYTKKRLTRTWHKFCDSHIFLIQKYGSQILDLYKKWM